LSGNPMMKFYCQPEQDLDRSTGACVGEKPKVLPPLEVFLFYGSGAINLAPTELTNLTTLKLLQLSGPAAQYDIPYKMY